MNAHLLQAAQITAERMLDSLFIGLLLALFAGALLRAIPRPDSATRFAVWFTALLATALLPLLDTPRRVAGCLASARPLIAVPSSWASYLAVAWAVVAGLALLRVGVGWIELRRLRRKCRAIDHPDPAWQQTIARLCPARRVEVITSDQIHVPTALGFVRPAVVIPAGLLQQLSPQELHQVFLHELAHLRRWDDWTNAVQKLVRALLFFHPAVWWIEGRISLEREMACDDAVLAETASPRAYAECLAMLAEKSLLRRSAALAQAAVNRIRQTTLRVARILDANRSPQFPARRSAVALVSLFAVASWGIATQAPRLVSFQDAPPPAVAQAIPPAASLPGEHSAAATPATGPAPRVVHAKSKVSRRANAPAVAYAKATTPMPAASASAQLEPGLQQGGAHSEARVIRARTRVFPQPQVTMGVMIIVVDDPDFGPVPIVYRFTVWQSAPSQAAQPGAGQKKT